MRPSEGLLDAHLANRRQMEVALDRLASEIIELSRRHNFPHWLALGAIYRGWARSASGKTAGGISWIEDGIRGYRATGAMLRMSYFLALKAEALHLAGRTPEALEAIKEAEAWVERSEERWWCAELHRLRGVFLANLGAQESQIESSFGEAMRIVREQKSVSLEKRAERPTRSTVAKKRACQKVIDSDYLFVNRLQRAVSRFGCGKSSVIKHGRLSRRRYSYTRGRPWVVISVHTTSNMIGNISN